MANSIGAVNSQEIVQLSAVEQQVVGGKTLCAWGSVSIKYQDISLQCDEVEIDRDTLQLRASGHVILDQGSNRMSCERLNFDLRAKTGTLYVVEAFFPPSYHFRGQELEKLDETRYRLARGLFTSCDLVKNTPPWSLEVREGIFEVEGYGHFRGAAFEVKGVPIIYLPRLIWPIKRERATGLLMPSYGYNNRRGVYLGNAFYWPISHSLDTTVFVDLYSKGYIGLGDELRWAPAQNALGEIRMDTIRDYETKKWEWKAVGKHNQLFAGGYSLKAEINEASDLDFFQRYERSFDRSAQRQLYSHITLSRTVGPQVLNLRLDHRRSFFGTIGTASSDRVTFDKLPELEYRLRSTRIGRTPFYISAVVVADKLRVDRSSTLRGSYYRFDAFPTITLLTPGLPWLNVTPTIGARETYYSARYDDQQKHLEQKSLTREYFTGGLSVVGPSVSRVWNLSKNRKLKHLVEPRIEYSYVSNPGDVTRVPLFDEKDYSTVVDNKVRWTLANRLFYKSGENAGREIASFEMFQDYSFKKDLTYAVGDQPGNRRGPLTLWARATPLVGASLDYRTDFSPVTKKMLSSSLTAGYAQGGTALNLTWYSYYPVMKTPQNHPIAGSIFPLDQPRRPGGLRRISLMTFKRRNSSTTATLHGGRGAAGRRPWKSGITAWL